MRILPAKSKKGVTLVESVIAVVVLAIFAIGLIAAMSASGAKIMQLSRKNKDYAKATQQMDTVIAAVSNGLNEGLPLDNNSAGADGYTAVSNHSSWGLSSSVELKARIVLTSGTAVNAEKTNIRGWYLKLTCGKATVTGFVSNTQGVFDR